MIRINNSECNFDYGFSGKRKKKFVYRYVCTLVITQTISVKRHIENKIIKPRIYSY